MTRLAPLAALVAASALALSACGGGASTGSGLGDAAELVPAGAAAVVVLNTDGDSEQVERLRELVESFPGAREGVERMLREALDGGTWAGDVEPAVGDEVTLVFLGEAEAMVALTQPDDPERLRELAARDESDELEVRELEGWHAVGTAAHLDAFERARGGETLAESDAYADAFDELETDVLARFYGSGAALSEALPPLPGGAVPGSSGFSTAAGVVEALEDGLRFDARLLGVEAEVSDYEPELLDRVPDDAFLAASFARLDEGIAELRKQRIPFLPEVERALGLTLDELGGVFAGEGVLYVRGGIGVPEVTIATRPEDPDAALATLLQLARSVASLADAEVRTAELDGLEVHVVDAGLVRVQLARVDDAVVVTSGAAGLRDFRRDGDKLSGNDRFEGAAEDAGYDGDTAGLLYVDLQAALPVAEALAGFADEELPADVRAALERLDSFVTHSHAEGDGAVRMSGVLRTR